jgi:hypothetical protein
MHDATDRQSGWVSSTADGASSMPSTAVPNSAPKSVELGSEHSVPHIAIWQSLAFARSPYQLGAHWLVHNLLRHQ